MLTDISDEQIFVSCKLCKPSWMLQQQTFITRCTVGRFRNKMADQLKKSAN